MHLLPILAEGVIQPGTAWTILAALIVAVVIVIIFITFLSRYTKVGPNQVLIVSGRKHRLEDGSTVGFRIVKGGGTFVMPVLEKVDLLSLELLTIDVQTPEVYTSKGVPVKVDGVAQIKVKGDDVSIRTASEQFLGKAQDEIRNIATQTLEGHLRAILGTMTVEEIYQNRDAFASKVQEVAAGDMANMGLGIVSFTIRDIRDGQGYLDALGKPRIAQVKRDAQIAQAEADRDAMIKSSQATQAGQEAKFAADSKIAEAQRDYQTNVAGYQAVVNQKKAEADLAYDLQKFKTGQLVRPKKCRCRSSRSRSRSNCSSRKFSANSANSKPMSRNRPMPNATKSRRWPTPRNSSSKPKPPVPLPPPKPRVLPAPMFPRPPVWPKPKRTRLAVWPKPPSSRLKAKPPLQPCRPRRIPSRITTKPPSSK